jgi:hypothetical protein
MAVTATLVDLEEWDKPRFMVPIPHMPAVEGAPEDIAQEVVMVVMPAVQVYFLVLVAIVLVMAVVVAVAVALG